MPKLSKLVGKPIISADTGERIGKVSDVLLDLPSQHVIGLVVAAGVLNSEHVLPYADVQTLGKDAVVARAGTRVVSPKEWRKQAIHTARASALKHRRVLTRSGRALGEVHDVLLDDAGSVEAFEVTGSTLGALLHRRSMLPQTAGVTVGADAVLVPDDTAAAMESSRKSS
jgi:uncharacterized protein YrrD